MTWHDVLVLMALPVRWLCVYRCGCRCAQSGGVNKAQLCLHHPTRKQHTTSIHFLHSLTHIRTHTHRVHHTHTHIHHTHHTHTHTHTHTRAPHTWSPARQHLCCMSVNSVRCSHCTECRHKWRAAAAARFTQHGTSNEQQPRRYLNLPFVHLYLCGLRSRAGPWTLRLGRPFENWSVYMHGSDRPW